LPRPTVHRCHFVTKRTNHYVVVAVVDLELQMPDEEAFSLLVRLMAVYDLQGHFLPEMPRLQMRLVRLTTHSFD
jgi:hypothetical protein